MTVDDKHVTPGTRRKRGKYGVWAVIIVLIVSVAAWGIQYFFTPSGQFPPPKELVWHNDLNIDLHHPDVLIESASLSQLPKDLLAVPFLRDTLTEDLVFYYQNNADRLSIAGSLRRIIFEHQLTLRDNLLETFLDQPADVALWHDEGGKLNHFMAVIKLSGIARLLEPLAKMVAEDPQLERLDLPPLILGNDTVSVYQLRYGTRQRLLFASHGDRLLLFSDPAMLSYQQTPSQDSSQLTSALLSGAAPWPESFGLVARTGITDKKPLPAEPPQALIHRISVSANYLGLGYQRFVPAIAGVRFDMQQQGWASYLALNGSEVAGNASFDFNTLWKTMPVGASFCLALPISQQVPDYLLQRIALMSENTQTEHSSPLTLAGNSGVCWYPDSNLSTPLFVTLLDSAADEHTDKKLAALFDRVIGAKEKQPVPMVASSQGATRLWQREVSSLHGRYPRTESPAPQQLLGNHFFRVSLARNEQTLLFSLDDKLVNKALQTMAKKFPPLAEILPQQAVVPIYMAPEALSDLFKQEVFASLPKSVEPIFYNAAQTLLLPKLSALAGQQRYALQLPAGTEIKQPWQWLPLEWQGL